MFTFLLVIHAIIAAALVAVILMQRSEGGGLGMGGSPSGLMSARGAADFLTRATTILAALFVIMSITLATYASFRSAGSTELDTSLARTPVPTQQTPAQQAPGGDATVPATDPLAGGAAPAAAPAAAPTSGRTTPAAPKRSEAAPAKRNPDPVTGTSQAAPAKVAPPPVVRTTAGAAAPAAAPSGPENPGQ